MNAEEKREKRQMKRKRLHLFLMIMLAAFFLNAAGIMHVAAAEDDGLVQDEETHRFYNTDEGTFDLNTAKKADYYMGVAVDESTGLKYAFIQYEDKLWAVVATKKNAVNGSYDTSSYISFLSQQFEASTTKTCLLVKKNKTGNEYLNRSFYYGEDDSIFTTGFSKGIYYIDGVKAKGIKKIEDKYHFFKNGKQITKKGWYASGNSQIYISNSQVKYKFDGVCCYQYKNGKKKKVTNRSVLVNQVTYRFDSNGVLAQGGQKVDGELYYFKNGRMKTNCYKTVDGYGRYFGEDGKAVKNTWVCIKKVDRYFDAEGRNTKRYYREEYSDSKKAGRYAVYKQKKWVWMQNGIYRINGMVYFIKNGQTYTGSCWYDTNDITSYYVKKGVVTYKRLYKKETYTLYYFANGRWEKATDTWTPEKKGEIHYYDADGNLKYKYFSESYKTSAYRRTLWVWSEKKSKWKKQKNKVVQIKNLYYCASGDGTLYDTKGWHTIDEYTAAYTDASGKVTRYIRYDKKKKCSIYRKGKHLDTIVSGIITVKMDGQTVYYMMDASGKSCTGSIEDGMYIYDFDAYGRAYSRRLKDALYVDMDVWMKRVMKAYLGNTGIYCNVFVDQVFSLAGGDSASPKMAVRYQDETTGGIILDRTYLGTEWGGTTEVKAKVTLSDGTAWTESEEIVMNSNITDFSYKDLTPGDVIVYYKKGETDASHVSLYLGQFQDADAVRDYLKKLGVKKSIRETCVKDWGIYYGNDGTYWCIHGGMGSNSQVYISNSTYCIPASGGNTYARKIVNIFQ